MNRGMAPSKKNRSRAAWPVSGLISLQRRLAALTATAAGLIAQLRELNQLRERVRKAQLTAQETSGGPGGLGESGILIQRAHMINEALTNWW